MKRLTAILVAALVMMSVSLPVMAEPDNSSAEESSQAAVSEQSPDNESSPSEAQDESTGEGSVQGPEDESAQESTEEASNSESTEETSKDESKTEESRSEESREESKKEESKAESQEASKPEKVKMISYRIQEAGMKMSIPSDMYVITRDTDKDDPVLAINRTTKEDVMKNFQENDIYLRTNPKDFTFVVNVTVSETEDTKAIGELSMLSEDKLQSIIDKLLQSEIYTGCTKSSYGGLLFLTFTISYESGGTKVEGLQQYTINDGKCIKITYQSAGDNNSDANKQIFYKMMDSLRFDGVRYEPMAEDKREAVKPLTISDIDIRYIYIIIASVVGIIALMIMIIAGIRYKKTKAVMARQKAAEEERQKKKAKVTFMDHDDEQTEIFSDTDKKKGSENEKHRERSREMQNASITGNNAGASAKTGNTDEDTSAPSADNIADDGDGLDMFGRPIGGSKADIGNTDIIDIPADIFDTGRKEPPKETETAYKLAGPEDEDDKIIEEAAAVQEDDTPNDKELFRAIEEAENDSPVPDVSERKTDIDVVFADSGRKRRTEIEQIVTSGTADADKDAAAAESSFFDQMVERLRETNAQVGQDISRMEKNKGSSLLAPAENGSAEKDDTTNEGDQGDSTMNNAYASSKKDIELEISKSEDGSLVIGALNNNNGRPVGIEIRDASNFKEDRDREMAELGFEVANDNEIYNARKEANAENPFVVRAKSEEDSRYDKLFGQSKDKDGSDFERRFGKGTAAGSAAGKTRRSDRPAKSAEKNTAVSTASTEVKVMTNENTRKPIIPAGTAFEGDSGITFEVAPAPKREVVPMQSVFTNIPRLESVSAEDYNKEYEQMKNSMPRNHVYAQRFSASDVPQPFVETPRPITGSDTQKEELQEENIPEEKPAAEKARPSKRVWTTEPVSEQKPEPVSEPEKESEDDGLIEFYTGYDQNDDPFANPNNDQEVVIRDHKKKSGESMGQRFRRSLGKLFSSDIPDDEE